MADRAYKEPKELWVKVLNGLYYQNGDITSVRKGSQASWAWASLLKGRYVLTREGVWTIGDGATIRAGVDQWLYNKEGFKVDQTEGWELNREVLVGSLIDRSRSKWNTELLRALATPGDVDQILSIPILMMTEPDQIVWLYTDHDRVTVKTAYHRLREAADQIPPSINTHGIRSSSIWSAVWKSNTLPKVRNFAWKLLTNALHVMANLTRRGMEVRPLCVLCGLVEDVEYMLYRCEWTKMVWFGCLGLGELEMEWRSVRDWLTARRAEQGGTQQQTEARWALCLMTCWKVWQARCKAVFEQQKLNPREVVDISRVEQDVVMRARPNVETCNRTDVNNA